MEARLQKTSRKCHNKTIERFMQVNMKYLLQNTLVPFKGLPALFNLTANLQNRHTPF